jgi:hypothetical protein
LDLIKDRSKGFRVLGFEALKVLIDLEDGFVTWKLSYADCTKKKGTLTNPRLLCGKKHCPPQKKDRKIIRARKLKTSSAFMHACMQKQTVSATRC